MYLTTILLNNNVIKIILFETYKFITKQTYITKQVKNRKILINFSNAYIVKKKTSTEIFHNIKILFKIKIKLILLNFLQEFAFKKINFLGRANKNAQKSV